MSWVVLFIHQNSNLMLKIYFAGSIRGGRGQIDIYQKMIAHLKRYGQVLTEHIGEAKLTEKGERDLDDARIYQRDIDWLKSSDMVVAEVSNPSLGVGFEIAKAIELHKQVLCFYRPGPDQRLSAMIAGCPDVKVFEYDNFEDFTGRIDSVFK